ncbi:MAG: LamG-like jellyroll fold domain-containing protein [Verrucomicrobiota bacterium JB022]|nr:LamG-like jellyroll fold domain-containing protein [Verrucomicrobiota bacterium JB022]
MKPRLLLGCLLGLGTLSSIASAEPYKLAVLPDIQYYYNNYQPGNYAKLLSQMRWLAEHTESDNLQLTLQLGDITQNDNNVHQWTGARAAFDLLNDRMPYVLAVGNHDGVDNGRVSYFPRPEYFGPGSPYATQETVGGSMVEGDLANSYHFIDTGERTWLVLTLEWAPRDAVIDWADEILSRYPEYRTILITHGYFFRDNMRYDYQLHYHEYNGSQGNPKEYEIIANDPEGANDGQDIWRKLVKKHPQVALIYSGHVGSNGVGRRLSIGSQRQVVRERLTDFQGWTGSGNGWMQTLKLTPEGDEALVETFSPYLDEEIFDPDLHYQFPFFEDVLPASRAAALAEAAPDYHFNLLGQSARRPMRNEGSLSDGYYLFTRLEEGQSHELRGGQVVKGNVVTPTANWTLATWVRLDASMLDMPYGLEIAKLGGVQAFTHPTAEGASLQIQVDAHAVVTDAFPLQANRWYFLALSHGADGLDVYLDGERIGQSETPVTLGETSMLKLGSVDFSGEIADASLFHRTLSMQELQRIRLAAFTEVQAGQITLGAQNSTDATSLPGFSFAPDGTGRANVRRTERSYLRYGGNGVFDQIKWMDDPLHYTDGVLLATPRGKLQDGVLASVGVDRAYRDSFNGFHHGLRSGLSLEAHNTGGGAFTPVNTTVSYAFFPFASGFTAGQIGIDGVLIEENNLPTDAAEPVGNLGAVRIAPEVLDVRGGLLFATPGNADSQIVTVGQDAEGTAYFYPLDSYRDHSVAAGVGSFGFVYLPGDTPELIGGTFDGLQNSAVQQFGEATVTREDTGVYRIDVPEGLGEATLLLNAMTPDADASYSEMADNHLVYEAVDAQTYRVYVYDLPARTPEDSVFNWALVPNDRAFQPRPTLPAAEQQLSQYVPDLGYVSPPWSYSPNWGWVFATDWPWAFVQDHGWMWFEPTDEAHICWMWDSRQQRWYYLNAAYWPWIHSGETDWVYYLP